ncbi:hypothetical protein [Stenotrophomonas maltophilia]|uniref:hypothetical protein n=1 Tax=Stenotrophomonas maltophilia TaxID=40324 RepID=UPI000C25CD8A|nr:hypothetical protein [Stenotrophomonas maltophilia]PJL06461.1 hypothetical protein B9Y63_04460 [Stenotrophomonas maltophilia]
MPRLSIYFTEERMPAKDSLDALTEQCAVLCTNVLGAALDNVHILYLAARQGQGHPASAELAYRLGPGRTPELMDAFMRQLDLAIQDHAGLTARIRCFGYANDALHARN